jgi:hypothetical protein
MGHGLRADLVAWLFTVNEALKFKQATYHLATR